MIQVVENRADIEGVVLAVSPDAQRAGHSLVTVEVRAVANVASYPNLFADAVGTRLEMVATPDAAAALGIGKSVRCRIRRTGPAAVLAEHCSQT